MSCFYCREVSPRLTPMGSIFKSSEVFKLLRDEKILNREAKQEAKEEARKKLTTFLQRPDRPVPKSKEDLEFEQRIPYKPNIIRQPKPRCDPNRVPSPPPQPNTFPFTKLESKHSNVEVVTKPESVFKQKPDFKTARKPACETVQKPLHDLIREPALERPLSQTPTYGPLQVSIPSTKKATVCEKVPVLTVLAPIQNGNSIDIRNGEENRKSLLNGNGKADTFCDNGESVSLKKDLKIIATQNKTDLDDESQNPEAIRLALEQLTEVQKQLLTLSSMRSTIQTTLGSIATQVEKLMFALKEKNDLGVIVE